MKAVRVGLLGLGTVGGGTVNVLQRNSDVIKRRAGRRIEITAAAVRDPEKSRICDTGGFRISGDPFAIVNDPDIDIVVELIGGESPARELVLAAVAAGKPVVTANKALIALHGNEIFEAAHRAGVMIAFEAAVAGGISIIKAIREGMAANRIESLAGIINGTTNYILSGMRDQGRNFADMLDEAQKLGYAEADPTFDISGVDAAHKLTILAAIAFGIPLQFERVYTEGIEAMTVEDLEYAEELGYRIKHLGIARRTDAGIEMRVHPTLVPARNLMASVDGVMNAVQLNGDAAGPSLYYGAGAGAEPTASAVVADLVDVVRAMTTDPENRVPHLAFHPGELQEVNVVSPDQFETAYYLHMEAEDRSGVLAEVTRILAGKEISIEAILQKEPRPGDAVASVVILTHRTVERVMEAALAEIQQLDSIPSPVTRIRVEHLD
jgi:homoserine dehydrogenase